MFRAARRRPPNHVFATVMVALISCATGVDLVPEGPTGPAQAATDAGVGAQNGATEAGMAGAHVAGFGGADAHSGGADSAGTGSGPDGRAGDTPAGSGGGSGGSPPAGGGGAAARAGSGGDLSGGASGVGATGASAGSAGGIGTGGSSTGGTGGSGASGGQGDVWLEIDYSSAYSPRSPTWTFSDTPGWGAAQWAEEGHSWPEAWDRFNNMSVGWDPVGSQVLLIGSGSELQLMIGLEELVSYSGATVQLVGRSCSTSSSVRFDVYNPLNDCGTSGEMSNDWTADMVDLDLGQCLLTGPGAEIEAVRVAPTSGSIALVRMRVTLHHAVW